MVSDEDEACTANVADEDAMDESNTVNVFGKDVLFNANGDTALNSISVKCAVRSSIERTRVFIQPEKLCQ